MFDSFRLHRLDSFESWSCLRVRVLARPLKPPDVRPSHKPIPMGGVQLSQLGQGQRHGLRFSGVTYGDISPLLHFTLDFQFLPNLTIEYNGPICFFGCQIGVGYAAF